MTHTGPHAPAAGKSRVGLFFALWICTVLATLMLPPGQDVALWALLATWATTVLWGDLSGATPVPTSLTRVVAVTSYLAIVAVARPAWVDVKKDAQRELAASRAAACNELIESLRSPDGTYPPGPVVVKAWAIDPASAIRPYDVEFGPKLAWGLVALPDIGDWPRWAPDNEVQTLLPTPDPSYRGRLFYARTGNRRDGFLLVSYGWEGAPVWSVARTEHQD